MRRKIRLIVFIILCILFLVFGPTTVFYSLGYRFDFETKKIIQTGGLFVKAVPTQVEIYINNKLVKKTDLFFGSALIQNLLPKKHKIEIVKDGYHSWKKELEIKEKQVVEIKNVVLFPKDPGFTLLTKNVENFWFFPDGKKIILKEKEEETWALKLYDLNKRVKSHLLNERDVSKKGVDLFNLKFLENSKEITLEVGSNEELKYFSLEIDKKPLLLKETKPALIPENVIFYQSFDGNIYFLDKLGFVFKSDSSFQVKEKMNEIAFPIEAETKYQLRIFPGYIFLEAGENLYLLNPDSKSFEEFFERIKDLKISPDKKKVVYFSKHEIWLLFLETRKQQFLSRFSKEIGDVFWLNSDYLVFNTEEKIKITEIDDRDRINIVDLAEFKEPKIFFNQTDKRIYILSEGIFYISKKLSL